MKKNSDKLKKGVYRFKIKNGNKPDRVMFPKNENEVEESDINLMMIFGMEKEARVKNPEKYNKVKRESENNGYSNGKQEYVNRNQAAEFVHEYSRKHASLRLKAIFAFILFICCAAYEWVVFEMNIAYDMMLTTSPIVVVLFAIQLLFLCIALGYRQYFSGFGFNMSKYPVGSVFTVLSTACFAYYTTLCIMLAMGKVTAQMSSIDSFYLTVVSFCLLLSIFEELNHVKREWKSFLVVSDKNAYRYTLDKAVEKKSKRFNFFDSKKSLSVKKTGFVSGFVSRCERGFVKKGAQIALVTISVLVSLGLALYRYIVTDDLILAFSVLIMSLILTLPFSSFITFSVGYKKAVDSAYEKGCTVIGVHSFEELSSANSVYFDDLAFFPPSGVKLKGFKAYGNHRIDNSLYIISSIYKKIDAPPAAMFIKAVGEGEQSDKVDIIDVSTNGIHAAVDGKPVYLGGAAYMAECGFRIPDGDEAHLSSQICVVYLVVSGSMAMKLYIEYAIDKKIVKTIESLRKYGIYLGIYTCDPSINDAMMNNLLPLSKYPIGISKSMSDKAEGQISPEISSGIVSNKNTGNLLSTLLISINTSHAVKNDMILKYFSLAAGVLISSIIAILGVEGYISAWFFILYQFFWLIPSYLIGKLGPRS